MASSERSEPRLRANRQPPVVREALPAPEDVFLAWLLALPDILDVATAARREVARLDAAGEMGPGPARLKRLLVEAATAPAGPARPRRKRGGSGG